MWRIKKRIFATIIQIIKENDKTNETMDVGRHPNLRHQFVDIVLGPQNFVQAFDAVIDAVEKGVITEERINRSVRRILKLKKK